MTKKITLKSDDTFVDAQGVTHVRIHEGMDPGLQSIGLMAHTWEHVTGLAIDTTVESLKVTLKQVGIPKKKRKKIIRLVGMRACETMFAGDD